MHQNFNIASSFFSGLAPSAAAGGKSVTGLAEGLFGDQALSFGKQLSIVMRPQGAGAVFRGHISQDHIGALASLEAAAVPGSVSGPNAGPVTGSMTGPMSGKGVMLAAIRGGLNMVNLDSDLADAIRNQILQAAKSGEITLPPAWTNALERGAVIQPTPGEQTPNPAELTDIMAALGLVASTPMSRPASVLSDPTASSGVSAASAPSGHGQAHLSAPGTEPTRIPKTDPAIDDRNAAAQAQTLANEPGLPSAALSERAPTPARTGDAIPIEARNTTTPNAPNASPTSAQAARNGVSDATGNGAKNGGTGGNEGGDGAPGSSGNAAEQRSTASNGSDAKAHPFLTRLESMLESRGLTIGAPLSQNMGLTGPYDDSALLPGMSGAAHTMNASATVASTPAAGHAPAMANWSPVAGQVAMQISRQAREGSQEFTIRLDPPELGRVDVKLDIAHDGKVNAVISVDNEKTLHLLQRDQSQLARALAEAGLETDSGSLNFSLNSSMSGQHGNDGDDAMGGGSSPRRDASALTGDVDAAPAEGAIGTLAVSDRPLDITV